LALDKVNLIRNEFYKVLLELFTYYKDFVGKDVYGEATFDIKRFCQISNKQFRQFYQDFFFDSTALSLDHPQQQQSAKLSNSLFQNFISLQAVNNQQNLEYSVMHF
jgi:hypothetical protein